MLLFGALRAPLVRVPDPGVRIAGEDVVDEPKRPLGDRPGVALPGDADVPLLTSRTRYGGTKMPWLRREVEESKRPEQRV